MRGMRLVLAMALALLVAGCASLLPGQQAEPQGAYLALIKKNLAAGSLYRGPATVAHAKALPLTAGVGRALATRRARAMGQQTPPPPPPEADRQVLLALYLADFNANDLEKPRPSWRVYLENREGARLSPSDRREDKTPAGMVEALYPFKDAWSRLYRLSFPGPAARPGFYRPGGRLFLVLAGPGGGLRLPLPQNWR